MSVGGELMNGGVGGGEGLIEKWGGVMKRGW